MVVGEAAGANEARDGLPFRPDGASGSLLERVWSRIGMARDQFFISNALHCQPPNNALEGEDYESEALEHCQHFLDAEIKRVKPRAILALGGVAMRTLSGLSGPKRGISAVRGFVLEAPRYDIPLIGSYHPAFLRRGQMSLMGVLIRDFQLALSVARQGAPASPRRSYNEYPTLGEAEAFCARVLADPRLLLAYDIETNYSHGEDEDEVSAAANQITQVQFSIGAGTGIAFPWAGDYIDIIRRILGSRNTKLGFNVWHFDNPILRSNGIEVGGVVEDLMWAWHHLQPDLPRNLQFVTSMYAPEFGPWKHLAGVNLADYGCRDVDVLQRIWPALERDLKARGIWRGYEQHVRGLWPILEGMSRRGMPLSSEKQAEFKLHLETALAKIDGELQLIYPEHLKDLHPKAGFVRTPDDTSGLVQIVVPDVTRKERQLCSCVTPEGLIASWTKKAALRGECCKGVGYIKAEITGPVSRWAELVPFKPSPPQLIRYMHFKGHKVPKVIGGNRETTSKLFIERMARDYKDPLYKGLLEYRSIQKFKGTYLWSIGPDGRVHPTFKYTPATGQLAATDPPVLTIPSSKAGPLAAKFRETIAARSGYTLLECIDPETRVLCHDMLWRAAKDLSPGDELVGFDEEAQPSGKRRGRKLRKSTVVTSRTIIKPRLRISTTHGEVICSKDHSWLTNTGHGAEWSKAETLTVGQSICYLTQPWEEDRSNAASYLAGFLDGEGYVGGEHGVSRPGFGQNPGNVSTYVQGLLTMRGYTCSLDSEHTRCQNFAILDGKAFTGMRVVGSLRPRRLLDNIQARYEGAAYWGKNSERPKILAIEDIGDGPVIALETSTHTFIADGFLSHNCDYKGFHTSTFAFEAKDQAYMRLANVIEDTHSFLTAVLLGQNTPEKMLAMADDELRAYLGVIKKKYKDIRDGQAKPAILGYALGMGANKLYEMNRFNPLTGAGFKSKYEAEKLIQTLRKTFPKGYQYQQEVRAQAHRQGYLINRFGFIRHFWDVMSPASAYSAGGLGEQAESAIAFNVQCDAHGHLKENLLELQRLGMLERYGVINVVHDSIVFEVETRLLEEAAFNVCAQMAKPSKVLVDPVMAPGGLAIGVEAKYGPSMGEMKVWEGGVAG